MDYSLFLPPLLHFREAVTSRSRQIRITRPLEKRMARQVARWFVQQGERVVEEMATLAGRFDDNARLVSSLEESISQADWLWIVERVQRELDPELVGIIDVFTGSTLVESARATLGDFPGMTVDFSLANPRAVAWAEGRAAAQVTRINETTRDRLNTIITDAVDNGWSWNRTASVISQTFEDFAGPPLFPSKKFFSRAQAVAAYEIGDAYEAGSRMAADTLAASFPMQKRWLSVRDGKVRPEHQANDAQGWIGLDASFQSGHQRPPTDPGCRCTTLYRRKRE